VVLRELRKRLFSVFFTPFESLTKRGKRGQRCPLFFLTEEAMVKIQTFRDKPIHSLSKEEMLELIQLLLQALEAKRQ